MIRKTFLTTLVLALATACAAPSDDGSGTEEGSDVTVITGVRLIDGTGGPAIENGVLVIEGDRFGVVGAASSVTVPEGATTIDLSGRTVMPPLINIHGHVARSFGLEQGVQYYTEENVRRTLDQYARYGVLHVLSLGADEPLGYVMRDRRRAGEFGGARMYTAGRGFGVEGGYPPPQPGEGETGLGPYRLAEPDEARAAVGELAENGADFVKIWVDDAFDSVTKLAPEVYRAIIDEAHASGLRVGAHMFELEDARSLVDSGVDGLVHSVRDRPVDEALIEAMLGQDVFLTPTLVREESLFTYTDRSPYLDDPFFTSHTPEDIVATLASDAYQEAQRAGTDVGQWQSVLALAQQNLKTLYDAGVKIGLGSDSGLPGRFEGYFEHRELELMAEAGLTPAQVIEIATRNSAEILGIDTDYGTIESGKAAEFLVLAADPLDDISNTKTLEQVWQAGAQIH
jgi:imidazolonepropionase-like amidohydrolase